MNETKNSLLAVPTTSAINGYPASNLTGNSTTSTNSTPYLSTISNNMKTRQAKVAVFTIKTNDKNEVISSKFVKELWVEAKNGASLDLIVAKELDKDFDPANTVIREITSIYF